MDKQKAWETLAQVGAIYKGTLQEHQAIQQALEALKPEQPQKV